MPDKLTSSPQALIVNYKSGTFRFDAYPGESNAIASDSKNLARTYPLTTRLTANQADWVKDRIASNVKALGREVIFQSTTPTGVLRHFKRSVQTLELTPLGRLLEKELHAKLKTLGQQAARAPKWMKDISPTQWEKLDAKIASDNSKWSVAALESSAFRTEHRDRPTLPPVPTAHREIAALRAEAQTLVSIDLSDGHVWVQPQHTPTSSASHQGNSHDRVHAQPSGRQSDALVKSISKAALRLSQLSRAKRQPVHGGSLQPASARSQLSSRIGAHIERWAKSVALTQTTLKPPRVQRAITQTPRVARSHGASR